MYAVDVIVTSGEGKPKESDYRVTVFKRSLDRSYGLKTKHGRNFYSEISARYPSLGFSINSFEVEISTKLGVKEALEHELIQGFPVLVEKEGNVVAQFKSTIMLLQGGPIAITGLPLDEAKFKTERKIVDEDLIKLLSVQFILFRCQWTRLIKRKTRRRRSKKLQKLRKLQRIDYLKELQMYYDLSK